MQAAVVSVLLMAGACGNSGDRARANPPAIVVAQSLPAPQAAQVGECVVSAPTGRGLIGDAEPQSRAFSPAGGIDARDGWIGCRNYSPVWLLKDCAAFYPGNYAVPYDYRETFNYPWHGPRPALAIPVIAGRSAALREARRSPTVR